MPLLAPIISAAISSSSAVVAERRRPTKMAGAEAGRTTRRNTVSREAP
jgi:hypothetical protein